MAKRHPSLVSLSQDHHHTLALALRLRQGEKALLTDGWTHDRNLQAERVQEIYRTELRSHFKAEEEVVFPAMREHVPASAATIDLLVGHHRAIEQLIERIAATEGTTRANDLVALGELLEKHVRIEERELFEMFQSSLPANVAEQVGEAVRRIHH